MGSPLHMKKIDSISAKTKKNNCTTYLALFKRNKKRLRPRLLQRHFPRQRTFPSIHCRKRHLPKRLRHFMRNNKAREHRADRVAYFYGVFGAEETGDAVG